MQAPARPARRSRLVLDRALENGRLHQRRDRRQARVCHRHRGAQAAGDSHHLGPGEPSVLTPPMDRMSLTPAQAGQGDGVCDAFEKAWQSGQRPRIEECLADVPEPVQAVLLDELLKLELAYRRQSGEKPRLEDYYQRFPKYFDDSEIGLK